MLNLLLSKSILMSRKVREEAEIEDVKETEKEELRAAMKELRVSRPWVHSRKISSMKRTQRMGFSDWELRKVVSRWPMKRFA